MVIIVIVFYKFNLTFVRLIHEVTSALVVTEQTETGISCIKNNWFSPALKSRRAIFWSEQSSF